MQQSSRGKKKIFAVMNEWLNTITTVTNEKMRETLYNIEQFRMDALNVTSVANAQAAQSSGSNNGDIGGKGIGSSQGSKIGSYGSSSNGAGSSSNPAQKGISSSTKTSGTSNLVSGGSQGNSLTGKNPFAILKASAIASTSTAKFPNNFTNLPKVSPPFLPALEGEAK